MLLKKSNRAKLKNPTRKKNYQNPELNHSNIYQNQKKQSKIKY